MSNPGPVEHQQMQSPGGLPIKPPTVKADQPASSSLAPTHPLTSDNWDTVVAAIHSISNMGQPILLTLTAQNMKPIWIDFHTRRFYMEALMQDIPDKPIDIKVFSHPVDPNDPPYPWAAWKSLDALLWVVGEKAFATGRAIWLILGERYTLSRWPNLTEISYGIDDLRSISMLANGMITIDELALVARTSIEHSQRLVSMLSLLGVIRGTGAPIVPNRLIDAAAAVEREVMLRDTPLKPVDNQITPLSKQAEVLNPPVYEENTGKEQDKYVVPAGQFALDDVAIAGQPLIDPIIDDELPNLNTGELKFSPPSAEFANPAPPPEVHRGLQAMVSGPSFFEATAGLENAEKAAPVNTPVFETEQPIARVQEFRSFSEIMQAQTQDSSGDREEEEAQPRGLFGLLRKKTGKK